MPGALARVGELPLERLLQLHAYVSLRAANLLHSPLDVAAPLVVSGSRASAPCCFPWPCLSLAPSPGPPLCPGAHAAPCNLLVALQEALQEERAEVTPRDGVRLTLQGLHSTAEQAARLRVRTRAGHAAALDSTAREGLGPRGQAALQQRAMLCVRAMPACCTQSSTHLTPTLHPTLPTEQEFSQDPVAAASGDGPQPEAHQPQRKHARGRPPVPALEAEEEASSSRSTQSLAATLARVCSGLERHEAVHAALSHGVEAAAVDTLVQVSRRLRAPGQEVGAAAAQAAGPTLPGAAAPGARCTRCARLQAWPVALLPAAIETCLPRHAADCWPLHRPRPPAGLPVGP